MKRIVGRRRVNKKAIYLQKASCCDKVTFPRVWQVSYQAEGPTRLTVCDDSPEDSILKEKFLIIASFILSVARKLLKGSKS